MQETIPQVPLASAAIRPDLRYAWYGPTLLITNHRGECGADQTLSGFSGALPGWSGCWWPVVSS